MLAQAATLPGSIESAERHDALKLRRGPDFVVNHSKMALELFSTSVVAAVSNPSSLLSVVNAMEREAGMERSELVPCVEQFDSFIAAILRTDPDTWNRHPHRLFNDHFPKQSIFCLFLQEIKKEGEQWLLEAVHAGREAAAAWQKHRPPFQIDGVSPCDREAALGSLRKSMGYALPEIGDFDCQVIARTFEQLVLCPFGVPDSLPMKAGSLDGAKLLCKHFFPSEKTVKRKLINTIPRLLVRWVHDKAMSTLGPGSDCDHDEKATFNLEMEVLDLWFDERSELVRQRSGIQKPFDCSDAEHSLCMDSVVTQQTMPNRKGGASHELHSAHTLPIKVPVGWAPEGKRAFMREFIARAPGRRASCKTLLAMPSHPHRSLNEVCQIDKE